MAHPEADLLDEKAREDQPIGTMAKRDKAPTRFRSDEASSEAGGSGSDPFGRAVQY